MFKAIAEFFRKLFTTPVSPPAAPAEKPNPMGDVNKMPDPNAVVYLKPALIEVKGNFPVLNVIGYSASWDKVRDPYAFDWFKRHPGYGKDVTLPMQVMEVRRLFTDSKEIRGVKNNPMIVWFFQKFTWLGKEYWNDETAECKAGWNSACETAGFTVDDSALARDGVKNGVAIAMADARVSDTAVCHHMDANGNYNGKHHITFIQQIVRDGTGKILFFYGSGANQNDMINLKKISGKEIEPKGAIRRLTVAQSMVKQ